MSQYENFLGAVLKDFDGRLQACQKSAEDNMKAYESYCSELRRQLELVEAERDQLQTKVESQRSSMGGDVLQLLSQMTALSVTLASDTATETLYQCQLLEGALAGLVFSLRLSKSSWEYQYEPQPPSSTLATGQFASSLFFPDYMLSRFLTSLLSATFSKQSSH